MKLSDVLHALVNRLPQDLDLTAMHAAIDEHFEPKTAKPTEASEPAPPAG